MVGVHSKLVSSWKAYPRANLFQKQLKSVYTRFKTVATKWPYSSTIVSSCLTEELETKLCKLDNDIRIVVIGRKDIDVEKLVVSAKSLDSSIHRKKKSSESESKLKQYTIIICYEKIKDLTSKRLQNVKDSLKHFKSLEGSFEPSALVSPLIVCEIDDTVKHVGREQFCENIKKMAQKDFKISLEDENIIISGKRDNAIGRRISDVLERDIVKGVYDLRTQLQDFLGDSYFDRREIDIIESDELVSSMQAFLRNGLGFVDILESNKTELPFLEVVLLNLVKVIRCAVMAPLASKNGLAQDVCNEIAHIFDFDNKMIKNVSKNARYHLSKLEKHCSDMVIATKAKNSYHQFPGKQFVFIAYVVRDDIKMEFKKFEDTLNYSRLVAIAMRKILFEIDGYLYSSKMTQGFDLIPKQTEIPRAIKEAVLGIDGVFGMGTIYGRVVIHLENLKNEKILQIVEQISEIMQSLKFSNPYRVVCILQRSTYFCLETGKSIGCECPPYNLERQGTLGGFAENDNGEIYALTCAHVVHGEHNAEHNVYNENKHVFGCSRPETTILATDDAGIDIAAVKVMKNEDKSRCNPNLKDEEGNSHTTTRLFMGTAEDLINDKRRVYKYGAGSQRTEGIVCSSDYSKKDNIGLFVLIGTVPTVPEDIVPYAKQGDSGSINCISSVSVDNVSTVDAVSMLCAGNFIIKDDEDVFYESFLLRSGIDRLNESGNVNLQFPATPAIV